ncbi:MAG TPA: hypothetical protein VK610_08140 [Rhodothermales bacterium]|nr:hypothetical protein [Rhodothermales bacterium]
MARFKDPAFVAAAFQPYLEPGEELKHSAYGVKQPSMAIIIPLMFLAVLPGVIATALLTKEYVVGLTNRRFIALRFKGKDIKVQEVLEYPLGALPPVKASTGGLFTHIKIEDPAKPFVAKFHRMGMPGNRENGMAMEAALTGRAA